MQYVSYFVSDLKDTQWVGVVYGERMQRILENLRSRASIQEGTYFQGPELSQATSVVVRSITQDKKHRT